MSAIFGIINKKGKAVDEGMIDKMQNSLLHRAVDDKAIFKEGNMMFGHHKLIVHRRQAREQQPLVVEELVITCDARIDNIGELFSELEIIKTTENFTDPFIILQAYKKWGEECVNHLEGEFCFAIWNKLTQTFFGVSDHIGFRTFFYHENKEWFVFASEIRPVELIKEQPLEINYNIFIDYFSNIKRPITYDKNINVLPSGHYVKLKKNNQLEKQQYYIIKEEIEFFKDPEEYHIKLLNLVRKKIGYLIDSDFPIAISLSGGLDSSFIAAIACELLKKENKKLLAFCSVLQPNHIGPEVDERSYIETLKNRYDNLEIHYVSPARNKGTRSDLNITFNAVEFPVNIFHFVDRAIYNCAKEFQVRTLLSGFGGDMTVSYNGNGILYKYLVNLKLLKVIKLFKQGLKKSNISIFKYIKQEILAYYPVYRKIVHFLKRKPFQYPLKKKYIKEIKKMENKFEINFKDLIVGFVNSGEIGMDLLLLRKHAINYHQEFFSPLLDKSVIEFFLRIPEEQFLLNGIRRSLIKESMMGLVPDQIINRTDKTAYSPDYENRILNTLEESIKHVFFKQNKRNEIEFINYKSLEENIFRLSKRKNYNNKLNENFYFQFTIISAEFYYWLRKK